MNSEASKVSSQVSELNSKASEVSSEGSELRSEATELHSLAICHKNARFLQQILTILYHVARPGHRGTSVYAPFSQGLMCFIALQWRQKCSNSPQSTLGK